MRPLVTVDKNSDGDYVLTCQQCKDTFIVFVETFGPKERHKQMQKFNRDHAKAHKDEDHGFLVSVLKG